MHTLRKLPLLAALLAPLFSLRAQTLLSNFSSSAGFNSPTTLVGTGSTFNFSSGVGNYTVSGPAENDFTYMQYAGAVGAYTNNWFTRVDVNYAAPGSIFTSGVEQFINLGIMITKTGDTPGVNGSGPTFNAFMIESNLYQNSSNVGSRDIRAAVLAPGLSTDDNTRYTVVNSLSTATATSIRVGYNATTHVLTASFDANGFSDSVYSFTSIPTLTADTSTWGMTASDTFTISLIGNSGFDNDAGGNFGPSIVLGQATLDNFSGTSLSAVPEPSTYAAMFGTAALGLAAWRRRSRRGVA
jgi:hypothetical protein